MRAVDTNVLVRLVTRDDPKQVRAAEAFVANGAWVPRLVLVEAMWALEAVYDLGPTEMATALEMFLSHKAVTLPDAEVVAAALAHYRKQRSLGVRLSLFLEVARKAGHLPLGTFDRRLSKLDGVQRL